MGAKCIYHFATSKIVTKAKPATAACNLHLKNVSSLRSNAGQTALTVTHVAPHLKLPWKVDCIATCMHCCEQYVRTAREIHNKRIDDNFFLLSYILYFMADHRIVYYVARPYYRSSIIGRAHFLVASINCSKCTSAQLDPAPAEAIPPAHHPINHAVITRKVNAAIFNFILFCYVVQHTY
ncbi:hypothetical protein HU200_030278 [Digitaria exilis]|uniref:Uncharacterized protein n=1 Tax=Digitaria exilis TaxID=1010633 RepID=A0A835BPC4_9POAL|nr:hypothetical protein HU200_030278 [Digitaria exilis]